MSEKDKIVYYWMWEAGHKGALIFILISLVSLAFTSGPWLWSLVMAGVFAAYFAVVVYYGIKRGLVVKPTDE